MSSPTPKITPMMAQFNAIKAEHPDALVMMRLGDFYEMMGEDAEKAAPVLEITLTSRPVSKDERIPLCGVPYHAVDRYIAKLIAAGFRVAIADQMEDPKKAKGIVKRQVTRVITPGTVVEDSLLPGHANNFLVAVAQGADRFGLAVARWTFNRSAHAAMDRYVHALRWAGQNAAYDPPNDDPFLNHTFGPDWVQVTFE